MYEALNHELYFLLQKECDVCSFCDSKEKEELCSLIADITLDILEGKKELKDYV